MRILLALVCDAAHRDAEGRLHVTGQYQDLFAPGFPAKHDLTLVVVMEWAPETHGRYAFVIELVGPEGETNLRGDGYTEVADPDPAGPPARTHYIEPLEGVVFPEPGEYRFRIRVEGAWHEGPTLRLYETGGDPEPPRA